MIGTLIDQAYQARKEHRLTEARRLYSEAVLLLNQQSDPFELAHTIRHVADIDRETGNFPEAERAYRECLVLYRDSPNAPKLDLANTLNGFAKLPGLREVIAFTKEARDIYATLKIEPGVAECTARLKALQSKMIGSA